MAGHKILVITTTSALSNVLSSALSAIGAALIVVPAWQKFQVQDKPMYSLALLDIETLGAAKFPELKTFLANMKGLPVIVLYDASKVSNRDTVEILGAGANDMIAKNTPPPLLAAKIRAHLRRSTENDRAAGGWLHT